MFCFSKRLNGSQRRRVIRQRLGLLCVLTAAGFTMAAGTAQGALIQPITATDVPVFNTASVFDASHTGNVYTMQPATQLVPGGFDVRDLFGGSFGTYGWEHNDVVFNNDQPAGTLNAVDVTLAQPVSLTNFHLYLEDDGTIGDRSASEFKLFAGGQLVDDVQILNTFGNQSYTGVYGSNFIDVTDTLTNAPVTADYTLEIIQNHGIGGPDGVRALDFRASGTSSVPEPASMAGVLLGGLALCGRRKRT
jgi:hypothetical protein